MRKKESKKQIFAISIDPYNQDCLVIVNGQFSDAIDYFKNNDTLGCIENLKHVEDSIKKENDYLEKVELERGSGSLYTELPHGYVMIISDMGGYLKTIETIVHESLHLTHYILRRAGINLCKESEEAYTYLQARTVTDIIDNMAKKEQRSNKEVKKPKKCK